MANISVCWMIKRSSERLQDFVAMIKVFQVVFCILLLICFLSTCLEMFKRQSNTISLIALTLHRVRVKVHGKAADKWIVDLS